MGGGELGEGVVGCCCCSMVSLLLRPPCALSPLRDKLTWVYRATQLAKNPSALMWPMLMGAMMG
jgi:hypothetical protein